MKAIEAPLNQLRQSLAFAALAIPLIVSMTVFLVVRSNLRPFREITEVMATITKSHDPSDQNLERRKDSRRLVNPSLQLPSTESDPTEVRFFREALVRYASMLTSLPRLQDELEFNKAFAEVMRQVAHDIRSPLAALEAALKDVEVASPQKRLLMNQSLIRIREIADSTLQMRVSAGTRRSDPTSSFNMEPISSSNQTQNPTQHRDEAKSIRYLDVLNQVVDEIRIRALQGTTVQMIQDETAFDRFVEVVPSELGRALANILNNSIEAMAKRSTPGTVICEVGNVEGRIRTTIKDNGCGIPESVLPRIFQKEFSHGKPNGTGLGLYQARGFFESAGGSLTLSSYEGVGTTVNLSLPSHPAESWFYRGLAVIEGTEICICDDRPEIHEVWKQKLRSFPSLIIRNFHQLEAFAAWSDVPSNLQRSWRVLMDLEFPLEHANGLEILASRGLQSRACLMTGRELDLAFIQECQRVGVQILSKTNLASCPIYGSDGLPEKVDMVLLEDDPWTVDSWKSEASIHNVGLWLPRNADSLWAHLHLLDADTPIYVDEELGYTKGGHVVLDLIRCGYKDACLATGHQADFMKSLYPHISVTGKTWPGAKQKR